MNIFASSPCPVESAQYLDNKRVVKMVLESAQLLSNALAKHSGRSPYKATHTNHPCSIWASHSRANYTWLLQHYRALCAEYTRRYGKVHRCQHLDYVLTDGAEYLPHYNLFTEFPNCTDYKDVVDVHLAYQLYLNDKWDTDKREPAWY